MLTLIGCIAFGFIAGFSIASVAAANKITDLETRLERVRRFNQQI